MPDDPSHLARRLQAVLLADIKDYSATMGADEVAAIAGIDTIRRVFERVVPAKNGVFETSGGDAFLALFESAVHAVEAAVDIQTQLAGRSTDAGAAPLRIRIGIHMGDVVRTSFDQWMGHAIDVAARIQTLAPPGGVAISDDVYRAVRNCLAIPFVDMGRQHLKNVGEQMRVYAWTPTQPPLPLLQRATAPAPPAHAPLPVLARRALIVAALCSVAGAGGWYWWSRRPGAVHGAPPGGDDHRRHADRP